MSNRGIAVALLALGLGCGGVSKKQVSLAKSASYQCPRERMATVLEDEMTSRFASLDVNDPAGLRFISKAHPYSPNGAAGNRKAVKIGDYIISVGAQFKPMPKSGYGLYVNDEVHYFDQRGHRDMTAEELAADDPRRPAWLDDRIDEMTVAVFERLRDCTDRAGGS